MLWLVMKNVIICEQQQKLGDQQEEWRIIKSYTNHESRSYTCTSCLFSLLPVQIVMRQSPNLKSNFRSKKQTYKSFRQFRCWFVKSAKVIGEYYLSIDVNESTAKSPQKLNITLTESIWRQHFYCDNFKMSRLLTFKILVWQPIEHNILAQNT